MCLAVAGKLTKIEGLAATVEVLGAEVRVRLDFVEEPQLGEYVLIHAGFAIAKVSEEEAVETAELLRMLRAGEGVRIGGG